MLCQTSFMERVKSCWNIQRSVPNCFCIQRINALFNALCSYTCWLTFTPNTSKKRAEHLFNNRATIYSYSRLNHHISRRLFKHSNSVVKIFARLTLQPHTIFVLIYVMLSSKHFFIKNTLILLEWSDSAFDQTELPFIQC